MQKYVSRSEEEDKNNFKIGCRFRFDLVTITGGSASELGPLELALIGDIVTHAKASLKVVTDCQTAIDSGEKNAWPALVSKFLAEGVALALDAYDIM